MPSFTSIASVAHKTFSLELALLATQQRGQRKVVPFAYGNKCTLTNSQVCAKNCFVGYSNAFAPYHHCNLQFLRNSLTNAIECFSVEKFYKLPP